MNPVSLPPEIQSLKRLWTQRFKVLMDADKLLGTEKNKDVAHAYLQCAEELENPPLDLLKQYEECKSDINAKEFERLMKIKEQIEKDHAQAIHPKFKCGCRQGEVCVQCSETKKFFK